MINLLRKKQSQTFLKLMLLLIGFTSIGLVMDVPALADIYGFQSEDGKWKFIHVSLKNVKAYDKIIQQAANKYNVEISLIKAVIKAESDYQKTAISRKGAQGLMQLMPQTADGMNVNDPFDPKENIFGGTRYLSILLKKYNNNKSLALAAYNAGPEMVDIFYGIPPFQETRDYVRKALQYYKQFLSKK